MTTGPGGGSGTGPGGGGGTGPGRDYAVDASQLLAEVDRMLATSDRPSLADVVTGTVRALTEALDTLDLEVDPATEPTVLAGPSIGLDEPVHDYLLAQARTHIQRALFQLAIIPELPTPVRQSDSSSAAVGLSAIATPGGPVQTPHWHEFLPRH